MSLMKLLIFGPQLSGKGTQAANIAKEYSLAHITTGGIIREMYASGDQKMRELLEPCVTKGILLGDESMNPIVQQYLDSIKTGFILDGYPRTIEQMRFLDTYLSERHVKIDAGIFLDVSHEELMRRLEYRIKTESRADDHPEILRKRIEEYERKTLPVIKEYEKTGILLDINGEQTREQVFAQIRNDLDKLAKRPA